MTERRTGYVEWVTVTPERTFTTADAAAGDSTLLVTDASVLDQASTVDVLDSVLSVASVVFGEGEDEPDVVTLVDPLPFDVPLAEAVEPQPPVLQTHAHITFPEDDDLDDGDVVSVRVDQDFQAAKALAEAMHTGDPSARPVVGVESTDGAMRIVSVDGRLVQDGRTIDPGTLPPAEAELVAVAPESSPSITQIGRGPGSVALGWEPVADEGDAGVTYDVQAAEVGTSDWVTLGPSASPFYFMTGLNGERQYRVWAHSRGLYAPAPGPAITTSPDKDASSLVVTGGVFAEDFVQVGPSNGPHMGIYEGLGLAGYGGDGTQLLTQIGPDGRLQVVDGSFSGAITGGSISIAQGTEATLDQGFDSASGTTPPTGWTRITPANTVPSAGVFFDASGGSPGRRLRLQMKPYGSNQVSRHATYPTDLATRDVYVAFDYMWTGSPSAGLIPDAVAMLKFRTTTADAGNRVTGLRLRIDSGGIRMLAPDQAPVFIVQGFDADNLAAPTRATQGAWYRVEVAVRGATAMGRAYPKGSAPNAWSSGSIASLVPTAGLVAYSIDTSGGLSTDPGGVDQAVHIDNVHIEALRTGLEVQPDGGTSIERLNVNQSAEVPDPLMPGDAVPYKWVNPDIGTVTDAANYVSSDVGLFRVGKVVYCAISITRTSNPPNSGYITAATVNEASMRPPGNRALSAGPPTTSVNWSPKARVTDTGEIQIAMPTTGGNTSAMNVVGFWRVA